MEATIIHERSEPEAQLREMYNVRLKEAYGIDTLSGLPMWRIAWGPSQFAKQFGTYRDFTESGLFIREVTEVREVPKYDYLNDLYLLELLQVIPTANEAQMVGANLSYECIHPYMHKVNQTYLPPNWAFTEWVIDCYYAAKGQKSLRKYVEDDVDVPAHLRGIEAKRKRVDEIYRYLYGNETRTTDALAYGSGVVVPNKQFGNSEQKD
jgi:hypothetical protein